MNQSFYIKSKNKGENMRKIVLLCAAGMSTSILVEKMKQVATNIGYECEINAYAISEAKAKGEDADIILLGPQVKFNLKRVQVECPNCPVEAIDMVAYGTMNGEKVLNRVIEVLKD